MKPEEAIKELEYDCNTLGKGIPCDTSWGTAINEAYNIAILALEKQIPKKLIEHHYEDIGEEPYIKYGCPNGCKIQPSRRSRYCSLCGQKLLWDGDGKVN